MKKTASFLLCLLLTLSLAACHKADTSKWQSNEAFADVVTYTYADTLFADFGTETNIKINDNNYEHFKNYIEELKEAGFRYLRNGDTPENYNLNNGTASWRCTNGKVYLQLIFSEDGTSSYEMFGCNIQIYGYSTKPESWADFKSDAEESTQPESEETQAQIDD